MSEIAPIIAAGPVLLPSPSHAESTSDPKPLNRRSSSGSTTSTTGRTPNHSLPSSQSAKHPGEHRRPAVHEESRRAYRRRSIDLVAEADGDVEAFVEELEQKRKQLDEQIHRFIAQKEREYKRYEQELRKKYQTGPQRRISQEHEGPSKETRATIDHASRLPGFEQNKVFDDDTDMIEDLENVRSRIDRKTAISGLEDVRPSYEREKELMGLFTPSFLPMLDGKPELGRSPSAPALVDGHRSETMQHERQSLQRSHTEPAMHSHDKNHRAGLGPRTPSSGSDGGKNLVSALKTSGARRQLKQLSVRIKLGDEDEEITVRPNEEPITEKEYAPVRQAEAMHHSKQEEPERSHSDSDLSPSSAFGPFSTDAPGTRALGVSSPLSQLSSGLTQGLAMRSSQPPPPTLSYANPISSNTDDLGDLTSPFPLDEETEDTQRSGSDWEVDFQEDIGEEASETGNARSPELHNTGSSFRSPTLLSPDAVLAGSLTVPMSKILSSSSSSSQPISPGFSRPSVREDPKLDFEIDTVDDIVGQGSLYDAFVRPSFSRNATSSSLGESFMARNAEEIMRRRRV